MSDIHGEQYRNAVAIDADSRARSAVRAILAEAGDRGGFDGWWDALDRETRDEVRDAWARIIIEEMG